MGVDGIATAALQPRLRPAESSRIHSVLLYATSARVERRARVKVGARPTRVRVASLPRRAQRDTIRVSCKSARVLRVEVLRSRRALPRQAKARELIKKLRAATAERRAIDDRSSLLSRELSFLDRLRPTTARPHRYEKKARGIHLAAWTRILGWLDARSAALRKRVRALANKRLAVQRKLYKLRVEARTFNLANSATGAWQVVATLAGAGRHRVKVSYMVGGVRWVPSYDLRYLPRKRVVRADYYAKLRQRTGEDWRGVRLRFSTTLPTQLLAVPELPTWSIGRKRDFFPTPRPRYEPAPRYWRPRLRYRHRVPLVLRELRRAIAAAPSGSRPRRATAGLRDLEQRLRRLKRRVYRSRSELGKDEDKAAPPVTRRPRPSKSIDGLFSGPSGRSSGRAYGRRSYRSRYRSSRRVYRRRYRYKAKKRSSYRAPARDSAGSYRRGPRQRALPWTDVGYRPPYVHPDLPAASAKGFRYVLYAPGVHDLDSDGKDRRVPLLRKRLKVQLVHRIVPGRSKAAYLMGELTNTTGRPILRGHANLFTGTMFSGRSFLNTALPGKKLRLPLGVDDGVKIARNSRQATVSSGVVFKDDVTRYTVSIEIANHHRYPINIELIDQVPVKLGKKVTVRGFKAKPKLDKPDKQGRVRWKGRVKARSKKTIEFSFEIVRPKDWELRQHDY